MDIFEDNPQDLHTLLNLILVSKGARRAMLIESANYNDRKDYYKVIDYLEKNKKKFNVDIKEQPLDYPRLLVYNKDLIKKSVAEEAIDNNVVLGDILDYSCPGQDIYFETKTRYGYSIIAHIPKFKSSPSITDQFCVEKSLAKIEKKKELYGKTLQEVFPDIVLDIEEYISYTTKDLIKKLQKFIKGTKRSLDDIRHQMANSLAEIGFLKSRQLLFKNSRKVDKKYAKYWLIFLTFVDNDPVKPLYEKLDIKTFNEINENTGKFERETYKNLKL